MQLVYTLWTLCKSKLYGKKVSGKGELKRSLKSYFAAGVEKREVVLIFTTDDKAKLNW